MVSMKHQLVRVTSVELAGGYSLKIQFDDQTKKLIDLEPVLHGEIFSPLKDPELFRKVTVDPEIGTLTWPNGADFDPDTLYTWEDIVDELAQRLSKFEGQLQDGNQT
jgi:hypothetical protein